MYGLEYCERPLVRFRMDVILLRITLHRVAEPKKRLLTGKCYFSFTTCTIRLVPRVFISVLSLSTRPIHFASSTARYLYVRLFHYFFPHERNDVDYFVNTEIVGAETYNNTPSAAHARTGTLVLKREHVEYYCPSARADTN